MLVNKVEQKPIVQLDIEAWIPRESDMCFLDLKPFLFKELVLKESEFREQMELLDWEIYRQKLCFVYVSNSAIIPQWAYMIVADKLSRVESRCMIKTDSYRELALLDVIEHKDYQELKDKRVFVKGCSRERLSPQPYLLLTQKLSGVVKSLAFGESCSSVPLFKN